MENFIISKLLLIIILTYISNTYCVKSSYNKIKNIENEKEENSYINSKSMTNDYNFIQSETITNINSGTSKEENQINAINLLEPLNLRSKLKLTEINLKEKPYEFLSFVETASASNSGTNTNGVFSFHTQPYTWTNLTTFGNSPSPRKDFAMVLADSFLVIFGGDNNEGEYYNDLFFYDIFGQSWININHRGEVPSPRSGMTAELYGSILWIFEFSL